MDRAENQSYHPHWTLSPPLPDAAFLCTGLANEARDTSRKDMDSHVEALRSSQGDQSLRISTSRAWLNRGEETLEARGQTP